ncbi:hypothetical protein H920_10831 [Fukomys damarensis]|uniref:Uncharacterized protein n=1 Tax=Fukomys damarensis TaxID=885580 RepID=A0A091DYC9_FUKDA|nr:hypothetical protein H920_10831 [Fukomys damarensis]
MQGVQEINPTLEAQNIQLRAWIPAASHTSPAKGLESKAVESSLSPASGLEQCLTLDHIEDLHREGPTTSGGSQKIYAREMRDPCHQAEGSTLEPGGDTVKIRAPTMKAADIPRDSEGLHSSSDENSLVHIRKTMCSKLLLENQQAKVFPSSSLFMAIGNNL